jgi:hypothetical protein
VLSAEPARLSSVQSRGDEVLGVADGKEFLPGILLGFLLVEAPFLSNPDARFFSFTGA